MPRDQVLPVGTTTAPIWALPVCKKDGLSTSNYCTSLQAVETIRDRHFSSLSVKVVSSNLDRMTLFYVFIKKYERIFLVSVAESLRTRVNRIQ